MMNRRTFMQAGSLAVAGALVGATKASGSMDTLIPGMKREAMTAPVSVRALRSGFSVLENTGGNITVFNGTDATLLVDSGIAEQHAQILRALEAMQKAPVCEVVNTHWHFDHASGNPWFREGGARLTAHENTLKHLLVPTTVRPWHYTFEPIQAVGRPTNLLKGDSSLEIDHERASIHFVQHAHTDGDLLVHFEHADIVSTGDIFWNGHFPFIDYDTGGSIDGMIRATEIALALSTMNTIFVPGHGSPASTTDLAEYQAMLRDARGAVADLKSKGHTQAEVVAARPTARFDSKYGTYAVGPDDFVALVFEGV